MVGACVFALSNGRVSLFKLHSLAETLSWCRDGRPLHVDDSGWRDALLHVCVFVVCMHRVGFLWTSTRRLRSSTARREAVAAVRPDCRHGRLDCFLRRDGHDRRAGCVMSGETVSKWERVSSARVS